MGEKTQISKRSTVEELVKLYQVQAERLRDAFGELHDVEKKLNDAFTLDGGGHVYIKTRHGAVGNWDEDYALDQIQRQIWHTLIDRLELRRMMSNARWTKLSHDLDHGECPPIDVETVMGFLEQTITGLDAMLNEAVQEVFEFLRPRGHTKNGQLKTNSEFEVPPKVIVRVLEYGGHVWSTRVSVSYHWMQLLLAMENVFHALDGKGSIAKTHRGFLVDAIEKLEWKLGAQGETDLFEFRCFKNGNLHLKFKRLDLLKLFNARAGGNRLRAKPDAV